ncbi:MAG: hypothetical protein HYX90_03520 [Chloroflexi bacterium]|nr:hypothetical protein [Chloroflexota bacterium]
MSEVTVKVGVNLLEKSVTFMANTLLQMGYRIEHSRGLKPGYMSANHQVIEAGLRTWLAEQKLLSLHFQILDPQADAALEEWETVIEYTANPREELRKPPVEQLEGLTARLRSLPSSARFRLFVRLAPDASEVPGWVPGGLSPLQGSVSEDTEVGEHGFGHVWGKTRYRSGTW